MPPAEAELREKGRRGAECTRAAAYVRGYVRVCVLKPTAVVPSVFGVMAHVRRELTLESICMTIVCIMNVDLLD